MTIVRDSAIQTREARVTIRAASLDIEKRTVDAVIASDAAIEMGWYREALLMGDVDIPESVPYLNSHSRRSITDILGSVSGMRVEGGLLIGTIRFAKNPEADRALDLIRDGHLKSNSVGYRIDDEVYIPEGEKGLVEGREYEGPVFVVRKWRVQEVSAVSVPADSAAVMRSLKVPGSGDSTNGGVSMAETTTEPEGRAASAPSTPETPAAQAPATPEAPQRAAAAPVDKTLTENRTREINEVCALAGLGLAEAVRYDQSQMSIQEIRKDILKAREAAAPPVPVSVVAGADSRDKFRTAAVDSILLRAGVKIDKPAAGATDLMGAGFSDLARHCIEQRGGRAPYGREECLRAAMNRPSNLTRAWYQGARSNVRADMILNHSTSDFPYILADAMNKALQQAYADAPVTYNRWCRVVPFSDFKSRYVNALSEGGDPEKVNEAGELQEKTYSERRESYSIDTYGGIVSITRQALINDDLSAFSRIPTREGVAMRRKIQKLVSDVLNSGATSTHNMSDGNPLFDASNHSNYGTSGTAFAEGTLQTALIAMRNQTGLQSQRLGIRARYLLVPANLEFTARRILESGGAVVAEYNSAVINPVRGAAELIVDDYLGDASSNGTTAWYLAADNNLCDTVEVGLLNGVDAPTVEEQEGFEVLGMRFRIYGDFGVKAIDWRGLYKATGQA